MQEKCIVLICCLVPLARASAVVPRDVDILIGKHERTINSIGTLDCELVVSKFSTDLNPKLPTADDFYLKYHWSIDRNKDSSRVRLRYPGVKNGQDISGDNLTVGAETKQLKNWNWDNPKKLSLTDQQSVIARIEPTNLRPIGGRH